MDFLRSIGLRLITIGLINFLYAVSEHTKPGLGSPQARVRKRNT